MNLNEKKPNIVVSKNTDSWSSMATEQIKNVVDSVITKNGFCNIMMTGGNTANQLYQHWAESSKMPLDKMHLYFGDERCVPPDHDDSNYAMVKNALFDDVSQSKAFIVRMEGETKDRDEAARSYEEKLPEKMDVILFGMGDDGHIASLFPNSPALNSHRTVEAVTGTKVPFARLTITPKVIANAGFVFLLATGKNKGKVLTKALESIDDFFSMPVRLTINGTWLLDLDAANQLQNQDISSD